MLNSLIKYLKQVKDFRAHQGRRHPLWLVLLIVILSRISGHEGYREMEYWVRINYLRLRMTFNLPSDNPPSYSTIRRVIKEVEWKEAEFFSQKIREHWQIENQVHWVKDVLLKEDSMKIQDIQVASNLALLNTLGLNIFRGLGFLSITQGRRWLGNHWEKLLALP